MKSCPTFEPAIPAEAEHDVVARGTQVLEKLPPKNKSIVGFGKERMANFGFLVALESEIT